MENQEFLLHNYSDMLYYNSTFYRTAVKVLKVILSCENKTQLDSARAMVVNFRTNCRDHENLVVLMCVLEQKEKELCTLN